MPVDIDYFYSITLVDASGAKTVKECGPYRLKAYDFSAVSRSVLCYAAPGTALAYAKKAADGTVSEAEYTVGGNGEWMTVGVSSVKPA